MAALITVQYLILWHGEIEMFSETVITAWKSHTLATLTECWFMSLFQPLYVMRTGSWLTVGIRFHDSAFLASSVLAHLTVHLCTLMNIMVNSSPPLAFIFGTFVVYGFLLPAWFYVTLPVFVCYVHVTVTYTCVYEQKVSQLSICRGIV